jgi:photosystem II stability/assembly factor-like uncharacterized protein
MNSKIYIAIIAVLVIAVGGLGYFLSQSKSSPGAATSQAEDTGVMENATYGHVHALFKVPNSGTILLGTHNGLFKSTDQGKTFVDAKPGIEGEFMNFAYDAKNNIIYAGGHGLGVAKSTDGGVTWTKTASGIVGDDIHALALNSLDSNLIYAFSVDHGVFGTKDGAKIWNRIDDGPSNPSVRSFGYMTALSAMDRSMSKTNSQADIGYLWAGTGGGLYSSFACFCGWTKDNAFPDTATIYTIVPDPSNSSAMLIGTKDGIYRTGDEGKTFQKIQGDIQNVAAITFDASNPHMVLASTETGVLYKSQDGGSTWQKN